MDDYAHSLEVEKWGNKVIEDFFKTFSNFYFLKDKYYQYNFGDYKLIFKNGQIVYVEVKTELRYTGNIFIETFSDKNRNVPGWIHPSRLKNCGYILFFFLDVMLFYIFNLNQLKFWCYGPSLYGNNYRFEDYREVEQKKYIQKNLTCGRLIHIQDFLNDASLYLDIIDVKNNFRRIFARNA